MVDHADAFLSAGEREFLQALNDLGVRFLLVGMSAALLQGARGATEDIDLWFENLGDERIAEAAERAGGFWVTRMSPPMLGGRLGDRFDVVTQISGLDGFDSEYATARHETLDGIELHLLTLDRIVHSKRTADREKDRAVLPSLETALKVMNALKKP